MNDSTSPLCIACNYPLKGLDSRCCPECGRAFDPGDPASVNLGRPLGGWGRAMIGGVGWPTMLVAVGAILALAWVTRWPGFWPSFWVGDAGRAIKLSLSKTVLNDFREMKSGDRVFVVGVAVWCIAAIWLVARELIRLMVLVLRRPGKELRPRIGRRRALALSLLTVGLLLIGFGWPYRMGVRSVATYEAYIINPGTGLMPAPPLWPFARNNDSQADKQLQIVRAEVSALPTSRARMIGLMDLIHGHAEAALPILIERVGRESDSNIRVAEIHLIGIYREKKTADALVKQLDNGDPLIRAAAIDALGILYSPAYPIPNGDNISWSGGELRTSPSIELHNIISIAYWSVFGPGTIPPRPLVADPIPMPAALRDRLAGLMMSAATVEEREAAARLSLAQKPAGYNLRYAEWGVWLTMSGESKLIAPDIEAEIPPFVHRMGDSISSLSDHVLQKMIIINKPVIHLTSNVPLAVDLETRIYQGRPWFAYPKPDDFSVGVESQTIGRGGLSLGGEMLTPNSKLAVLDKATLASFPDAREGYPWLLPLHRQRDTPGSNSYNSLNFINAVGVRWQSLIVSPQKLSWMQPPAVPDDSHFGWWKRLRDVDCSWVSSRGESERFLYYDGPTLAPAIGEITLWKGSLGIKPTEPGGFTGILIEVKDGQALATTLESPGSQSVELAKVRSDFKPNAREQLQGLLQKRGLKPAEAKGLLDCWKPQFFETPGLRFILIFGTDRYDLLCPMNLRPAATPGELVRVGLQLTELGRAESQNKK